ncbi:MAG: conjugal transfer protein TrbE [Desulfovibrio sp.]|jgi:type IV secretion system protein VirB4|nr:conjugal transfer protein TrbE [Desulfovibrio sp.]
MLPLRDYRSKAKGLPDLLPYAALLAPDTLLCKDGTLLASWMITGADTASSTEDELARVSSHVSRALAPLGSGWGLHVDAIRRAARAYPPRSASHFPDPVTAMIEEERRARFEGGHFLNTRAFLSVYFKAPTHQATLLRAAALQTARLNELESALKVFRHTIEALEDQLRPLLRMERLGNSPIPGGGISSDLLSYLEECITGEHRGVRLPKEPMYLDGLIAGQDLVGGLAPRIGDQHIAVLSLDGVPSESWPAMFDALDLLPFPLRYSTRFLCLSQHEALKEVDRYRKTWRQKMFKFFDILFPKANPRVNRDAARMAEEAEEAYADVEGGASTLGYYTASIILLHDDPSELEIRCRHVRELVASIGRWGCRIETINAVEAWLSSHPGNWWANVRRPLITSLNLADFLPLASVWPGEEFCPCPFFPPESPPLMHCASDGVTPFRLNLHDGDLGHTLIFGPPGSGKSTLLAMIAAQFRRYKGSSVFSFDKGRSMYPLTKSVGGAHYDIGSEESPAFAPLSYLESDSDQAWAEEWVSSLCVLQGLTVLPVHRNAIHEAMTFLRQSPPHLRSLTDFFHVVQNDEVKTSMKHYTHGGSMGMLLDAKTDALSLASFTTFELEELMAMGEKNLLPVLLYIFRRIERGLTGQPALLMLDEAWVMLGHPVFREKIREWAKVLRKANCTLVIATQSLSDADRSGILDVLVESCPTKIYLPNGQALQDISSAIYRRFGLNDRQLEIVATATPKREYYVTAPKGRRLMSLALGPRALAFVGVSDKEQLARIRELEASHGDGWPEAWLEERSITHSGR